MAANYGEDDAGKFIPASRRADGTWRKPRRVKEGYVPPEEVPVYENKYVKFYKSKPSLPPGLSEAAAGALRQQQEAGDQSGGGGGGGGGGAALSKTAKKNLRRKEKRQQQQQHGDDDEEEEREGRDGGYEGSEPLRDGDADAAAALAEALRRSGIAERGDGNPGVEVKAAMPESAEETDPASCADLPKRIKNLKKKLRQIEELEQKIRSGELLQPSREQQEKLSRKSALERELASLE